MDNIIYKAYNYPIFQNVLYDTMEESMSCKIGDIELVQDDETGLIYNQLFKSENMEYAENYHNEQEFSLTFRHHLDDVKYLIEKHVGKQNLLEVGCGKGHFLEHLTSYGFDIIGMDPAYEGNNPNIKKEYYSSNISKTFNCIIMRHVLEHIENPYDFLCQLKENNNTQGLIYIEVPCFDWINNNNSFVDIFYEHVNYFRKIDFENMFDNIVDMGTLFNGQYLYVIADLSSFKKPIKKETFTLNKSFFDKLIYYKDMILNSNKKTVIWGCGAKGQILSFLLKNLNVSIDYFVDINPAKKDKYLALVNKYSNSTGGGNVA